MYNFNAKIEILKRCESTAYTICLKLLSDEGAAYDAAKTALVEIFRDPSFWKSDEDHRQRFLLKHCFSACMGNGNRASAAIAT